VILTDHLVDSLRPGIILILSINLFLGDEVTISGVLMLRIEKIIP
jgi:hypothetical protein